MFADDPVLDPAELTIARCGFRMYCGFDDWFMVEGGLILLLVVGALVVKRWRDLPLVALIAIATPIAAGYLVGEPAWLLYGIGWIDHAVFFAATTAIAAAIHALKRLAIHVFRRKPADEPSTMSEQL